MDLDKIPFLSVSDRLYDYMDVSALKTREESTYYVTISAKKLLGLEEGVPRQFTIETPAKNPEEAFQKLQKNLNQICKLVEKGIKGDSISSGVQSLKSAIKKIFNDSTRNELIDEIFQTKLSNTLNPLLSQIQENG